MKFYAVRVGRTPGVYATWERCKEQVTGFSGADFKSFPTQEEATVFVSGVSQGVSPNTALATRSVVSGPVDIWVDGACLQHGVNGMKFGWAFVVYQNVQELHRASGHDIPTEAKSQRNVAGEICSVLRALSWCHAQGIRVATIHYDYQGLANWPEGKWKAKTSFTQQYVQTVREYGFELTWKKVRAHSGEPCNDLVDQLAREAAEKDTGE